MGEPCNFGQLPRRDCVDCGMPIDARRLEALPATERCVRCETERDRRNSRPVTAPP